MRNKKGSFVSKHPVIFGLIVGGGIALGPIILFLSAVIIIFGIYDISYERHKELGIPYLQTLKQETNVAVEGTGCGNAVFYTDGGIDIDAIEEKYALDSADAIAVSAEYVFFKTCTYPCDVYKLNRDLSDLHKIVTVPDYTDCSVNDYALYYTEDDGKHYVCNLFTDEVTYVGDDGYFNADFNAEREYTVEEGSSFWKGNYFTVTYTRTGEAVAVLTSDSFSSVSEISGSVLQDDLIPLNYFYYGDDIYFCVGTIDSGFVWDAALIFRYSPKTNTISYYSWIDTSGGFDSPCSLYVFDSSAQD